MSNKSRTPITIYPHKQGKASLSSCKVEFFDNSGELLFDAFEWDDSSKQSPRIDLRDYYDDYEADRLYSQIEQFRITVVISYDTTACLPEAEDKFFGARGTSQQDGNQLYAQRNSLEDKQCHHHTRISAR